MSRFRHRDPLGHASRNGCVGNTSTSVDSSGTGCNGSNSLRPSASADSSGGNGCGGSFSLRPSTSVDSSSKGSHSLRPSASADSSGNGCDGGISLRLSTSVDSSGKGSISLRPSASADSSSNGCDSGISLRLSTSVGSSGNGRKSLRPSTSVAFASSLILSSSPRLPNSTFTRPSTLGMKLHVEQDWQLSELTLSCALPVSEFVSADSDAASLLALSDVCDTHASSSACAPRDFQDNKCERPFQQTVSPLLWRKKHLSFQELSADGTGNLAMKPLSALLADGNGVKKELPSSPPNPSNKSRRPPEEQQLSAAWHELIVSEVALNSPSSRLPLQLLSMRNLSVLIPSTLSHNS
mmetsp:Transcript_47234/g.91114  ORF Transcript_47234/g.91114 Transcript_47234/m.91114 type:complete len:352 (-) Transcript_47234:7-1062(-)